MDKNYQTDMIVLDFAKAFDKVSHPRLLHKLEHYGIPLSFPFNQFI
jgi:hypothetical protein